MPLPLAYLFERFPAFTKTFCAREVAGMYDQGYSIPVISIRRPNDPRPLDIPLERVRITYLPDSNNLGFKLLTRWRSYRLIPPGVERDPRDRHRLAEAVFLGPRLRQQQIRHLHVHFAGLAARTAWWLKRLFDITYSVTGHANDIFVERSDQRVSLRDLVRDAAFFATETEYSTRFLQNRFPESAEKIHRVYNGLALGNFRPSDPSRRPATIISVGRLIAKKGFNDLILACHLLREGGQKVRCILVGAGPEQLRLRQMVDEFGLNDAVELVGPKTQPELRALLADSQIFVFPAVEDLDGDRDNLPTVVIEAMASALPVIATSVGGIPEMVVPDRTGLLIGQHDPAGLAAAITKLLEYPETAKQFGVAGRELAQEKFSLDETTRSLRALWERYIGAMGARSQ
jgi:colanic acid/amylovoran biosynthesis glycosyltransferase